MLEFELDHATGFITMLKAMAQCVCEVQIKADKNGLLLTALDTAHIRFFELKVQPKFFKKYNFKGKNELRGQIDLQDITGLLETESCSTLGMCFDEDDKTITLKTGDLYYIKILGQFQHTFLLKNDFFIEEVYDLPKLPELDYTTVFSLRLKEFREDLEMSSKVSDKIRLTRDNEGFLKLDGEEESEYHSNILITRTVFRKVEELISSCFYVKKLREFLKPLDLVMDVEVSLGEDMPLQLLFGFDNPAIQLTYLQAPKVESRG